MIAEASVITTDKTSRTRVPKGIDTAAAEIDFSAITLEEKIMSRVTGGCRRVTGVIELDQDVLPLWEIREKR